MKAVITDATPDHSKEPIVPKIKTTEEMAKLYIKHLNKLEDYANYHYEDGNCYFCKASKISPEYLEDCLAGYCIYCPLDSTVENDRLECSESMREVNLIDCGTDEPTDSYAIASPESILIHRKYLLAKIERFTDVQKWEFWNAAVR